MPLRFPLRLKNRSLMLELLYPGFTSLALLLHFCPSCLLWYLLVILLYFYLLLLIPSGDCPGVFFFIWILLTGGSVLQVWQGMVLMVPSMMRRWLSLMGILHHMTRFLIVLMIWACRRTFLGEIMHMVSYEISPSCLMSKGVDIQDWDDMPVYWISYFSSRL